LAQRESAREGLRCEIAPDLGSHSASQECVNAVVVPLEDLAEPPRLAQRIADHGTVVGLHAATSFPLGQNGFRETRIDVCWETRLAGGAEREKRRGGEADADERERQEEPHNKTLTRRRATLNRSTGSFPSIQWPIFRRNGRE
jgi:hypothetical protein